MSLQSVLQQIGKDLSHVGPWIEDGIKIAAPIIGTVDPPLAPIFAAVEAIFNKTTSTNLTMTSAQVQQIITSVATAQSIKTPAAVGTGTSITLSQLADKLTSLFDTLNLPSK